MILRSPDPYSDAKGRARLTKGGYDPQPKAVTPMTPPSHALHLKQKGDNYNVFTEVVLLLEYSPVICDVF